MFFFRAFASCIELMTLLHWTEASRLDRQPDRGNNDSHSYLPSPAILGIGDCAVAFEKLTIMAHYLGAF